MRLSLIAMRLYGLLSRSLCALLRPHDALWAKRIATEVAQRFDLWHELTQLRF